MTAWLQNVYDAAKRSAAPTAAAVDPDSSAATSTIRPQATAAVTTDARFSACAGSARVDPHEELTDREIERIPVARRDERRPDRRLERSGIAEVEPRQHRRPVEREGRQRDEHRRCRRSGRSARARRRWVGLRISARRAWRR